MLGPRLASAFEEIKALFDPRDLMNPGKIVRPARMDDRTLFRYKPGYATERLRTVLDWSEHDVGRTGDGFAKAVEMCNNNGHCRKFDAGVMCPSYRATRDEQHVTRGRANTLRLALSGQLDAEGLASDAVRDALELCVSCKGCKRECPTGVDMAKFKIEAMAARRAHHGLSLRDRLIAYLPRYAPVVSSLRGLANLRVPWIGALSERSLGIAARRTLPRWQRGYIGSVRARPSASDGSREAVLFVDTFTNYFAGENAGAAQRVLEAAGYRVHLNAVPGQRPLCCGRTFLAAGLVEEAKAEARRTIDALLPFARRGVAVVGLEPSCLLGMRDEFLDYRFGQDAALIASQAMLLEEFLVRERDAGRLSLALRSTSATEVLLHGHCHQKAFAVLPAVEKVLGWIPRLSTRVVETSCCGMAGAFGYEAEHYEISKRMAEAALLPAIRAAAPSAWIVADGFSCRQQILDGGGREALHVAQVLERALAPQ